MASPDYWESAQDVLDWYETPIEPGEDHTCEFDGWGYCWFVADQASVGAGW